LSPSADVKYYLPGGGTRTFTGFNPGTQTFAFEQYDQTRLTRTGPASYELVAPDGSKLVFAQSDGAAGTSRKVFLTQVADPHGNAVTLGYDGSLRLVSLTDAIGQVTTLAYEHPTDPLKITRVTDPFGRFATFDYDGLGRLTRVTDVLGLTSQFAYEATSDFITALVTPYGTNTFTRGGTGTTRWLETLYPDGSRDRVEFNQNTNGIAFSEPPGGCRKGWLCSTVGCTDGTRSTGAAMPAPPLTGTTARRGCSIGCTSMTWFPPPASWRAARNRSKAASGMTTTARTQRASWATPPSPGMRAGCSMTARRNCTPLPITALAT
jgi:YD repeat-containing protein